MFASFKSSWAPFKVADLRNKSSINDLTQGVLLWINFGAPAQMCSMIIFMSDKKKLLMKYILLKYSLNIYAS